MLYICAFKLFKVTKTKYIFYLDLLLSYQNFNPFQKEGNLFIYVCFFFSVRILVNLYVGAWYYRL